MIKLTVDNKGIQAKKGTTLLQACLENDIYIPNLCYHQEMKEPPASCRLCFVEMDGEGKPIASCTLQVRAGMVIRTDTPVVRRLQRAALQFLLSAIMWTAAPARPIKNVTCNTWPNFSRSVKNLST